MPMTRRRCVTSGALYALCRRRQRPWAHGLTGFGNTYPAIALYSLAALTRWWQEQQETRQSNDHTDTRGGPSDLLAERSVAAQVAVTRTAPSALHDGRAARSALASSCRYPYLLCRYGAASRGVPARSPGAGIFRSQQRGLHDYRAEHERNSCTALVAWLSQPVAQIAMHAVRSRGNNNECLHSPDF